MVILSFRLLVSPGGVELRPRRSQEVGGSPELQNGGLRALEEAWDDVLLEAFFSVKSGRFLCFWGVTRREWPEQEKPRKKQPWQRQLDENRLLVDDPEMLYEFSWR